MAVGAHGITSSYKEIGLGQQVFHQKTESLNLLSVADLEVERHGFLHRRDVEHACESLNAHIVLAQGQVALALPAIAPHQPAMDVLPAFVLGQDFLAELDARCVPLLL